MGDLWEAVKAVVPSDAMPGVENCIRAIGRLPGLTSWKPTVRVWFDVVRLLPLGLPLDVLQWNQSFDPVRERIARSMLEAGRPAPEDLAELAAGGLFAALKAHDVEYLKQADRPTPDLLTRWGDSRIPVETEVTSAKEKVEQIERQKIAHEVAADLHALGLPWDIIVHFLDKPSQNERTELLTAAPGTKPGQTAEVPHRWELRAQLPPLDRAAGVIYEAGHKDTPPVWWPPQPATPFSVTGYVAGPGQTGPIPRIRVRWGLSVAAYINPVEKKLNHFQGSGQLPFMIAIDVSHLPGGFVWYRENLPNYFPAWQKVSGVLAFLVLTSSTKAYWAWQIYENPHAHHPLPDALRSLCFDTTMESGFDLQANPKTKACPSEDEGRSATSL